MRGGVHHRGGNSAPMKPQEIFRLRSQVEELKYLQSQQLVTPCRLLVILIGSVIMMVLISVSITSGEFYEDNSIHNKGESNISKKPYIFDYECMKNSREDLMGNYGYSTMSSKVEKRSGLSIEEFWDLYDAKWPVIVTDVVPQWKAYRTWSKQFFLDRYSKDRVFLKAVMGTLQEGVGHVRSIWEFLQLLDQTSSSTAWTYMEDEMFLLLRPELREDIGTNNLQEENFFNLFPAEIRPWDCMMLWGSKHSRSTLHLDPYNWTAVSAVIWGRKHWKLFPPGQDQYLYVQPKVKCGFPLDCNKYNSKLDAFEPDYWKYPKFRKAEYIEVEQNSGELLVIPTGWFHQAYNEEETLSISSQMMNRNNYLVILEEIIKVGNINRKKLPPHFTTLMPPDQVKLFMSLLPKKILKTGRQVTDNIHEMLSNMRNKSTSEEDPP